MSYDSLLQSYNLGPPPIFCENVENVESELNVPGKLMWLVALEFIVGSVRPVVNLSPIC